MELSIGPYTISQRTEYSRFRLIDTKTKCDITSGNEKLLNEIIDEYNKQKEDPEKYFEIKDDKLVQLRDWVIDGGIKYLFIPDYVHTLCDNSLTSGEFKYVHLPENLKTIGRNAFNSCYNLLYMEIPKTVEAINYGAFKECKSLKEVVLPNIQKIDEYVFCECICLKNIVIPDTVNSLEKFAFYHCRSLRDIRLPMGLESIAYNAFRKCINLSQVDLPNTLKEIGMDCFSECLSLHDVSLPDSILKLSDGVFAVSGVKCINFPKNLIEINGRPFYKSNIKTLIINHDFMCDSEQEVILARTIEGSKIDKIVIDGSVKILDHNAFLSCKKQLKQIDYLGTKEEFEEFKKNNSELFNIFSNIKKVNILKDVKDKSCTLNINELDR